MAAAHRTADAMEKLGFPSTKMCRCSLHTEENPAPIEAFPIKTRTWSDGRVVKYPGAWCKKCCNAKKRIRRERMKKEDPEALREREKGYRESHLAKDREGHKEYQRFWAEKQRRAAGIPARNFSYRNGTDDVKDKKLRVTPEFIAWLKFHGPTRLEKQLDLTRTLLFQITMGRNVTIPLGLADRLLMAVNDGKTLEDFWDV